MASRSDEEDDFFRDLVEHGRDDGDVGQVRSSSFRCVGHEHVALLDPLTRGSIRTDAEKLDLVSAKRRARSVGESYFSGSSRHDGKLSSPDREGHATQMDREMWSVGDQVTGGREERAREVQSFCEKCAEVSLRLGLNVHKTHP